MPQIYLDLVANTSQARQQFEQLNNELKRLGSVDMGQGITKANDEALRLSAILKECFNVNTNQLDINKFLVQVSQYGMSWKNVTETLQSFGSQGQQALMQLNAVVAQGQTRVLQLNKIVHTLADQIERTAKIQLSYGVLNAFTNTFREAYRYAQDLNKSLTNIQIVTGKSTKQMQEFAVEANKSAKALSVSTTAYTDAALIFYQQGLKGQDVTERTNTVVKMSNVTGQSAEEVSSYMTAIWNNFYDGSKSLEYYADAITALGASTASSSEEIARGLSQFSAVADTVGLSYEYATAALATVVAQTRQSADTVGNSFKTIFARLESLNLGDTLEDDTTLTKYTAALEKVGINVQLQNGQLKNMDSILDELGNKWELLNDQQKNALAYTVAGARQYTNFIALMDNWDKVQQNIEISSDPNHALTKQADIYADSWEAANKRLKTSWQELYDILISDDFFKSMINEAAKLVSGISNVAKSLGGLKPIVYLVSNLLMNMFSAQLNRGVASLVGTLQSANNIRKKKDIMLQSQAGAYLVDQAVDTDQTGGSLGDTEEQHIKFIQKNSEAWNKLNSVQQENLKLLNERNFSFKNMADSSNEALGKELELLQNINSLQSRLEDSADKKVTLGNLQKKNNLKVKDIVKANLSIEDKNAILGNRFDLNNSKDLNKSLKNDTLARDALKTLEEDADKTLRKITEDIRRAYDALKETLSKDIELSKQSMKDVMSEIDNAEKEINLLKQKISNGTATDAEKEKYNGLITIVERLHTSYDTLNNTLERQQGEYAKVSGNVDLYTSSVERSTQAQKEFVNIAELLSGLAQYGISVLTSVSALIKNLSNLVVNGAESAGSAIMSLAITVIFALTSINTVLGKLSDKVKGLAFLNKTIIGGFTWVNVATAVITTLIALITVFIAKRKAAIEQEKKAIREHQEMINKQNELIDSTQNLSQKVQDLIDSYRSLKQAGQSTLSTFEDMKKIMPELIDYYQQLGFDTSELENALELAEYTGNIDKLLEEKWILDSYAAAENQKNIYDAIENGGKNMAVASSAKYTKGETEYILKLNQGSGNADNHYSQIINGVLEEVGLGKLGEKQSIDITDAWEMVEVYDKLSEAQNKLLDHKEASGIINSQGYKSITKFLQETKDAYEEIKPYTEEATTAALYLLETEERGFATLNKDLKITNEEQKDNTVSLQEYNENYDELIKGIKNSEAVKGLLGEITDEQAAELLNSGAPYEQIARIQKHFETMAYQAAYDLAKPEDSAETFKANTDAITKVLDEFYYNLDDRDKHYSLFIDPQFDSIPTELTDELKEQWQTQIDQLREEEWQNDILKLADAEDIDIGELESYATHLQEIADTSDLISDELDDHDAAAKAVARDIMRMNEGLEELNNNSEDWIDAIKNSGAESQEYADAMHSLQSALSKVYDVETKWLKEDVLYEHLELVEKAAEGDVDAIEELRSIISEDIFKNIKEENANKIAQIIEDNVVDSINSLADLDAAFVDLQNTMNNMQIGDIGDAEFIAKCNDIIAAAGMTAEQAKAFFNSMGFETKFVQDTKQMTSQVPKYRTYHTIENEKDDGEKKTWEDATYTVLEGYTPVTGEFASYNMTTDGSTPKVESITKTSNGAMANIAPQNAGGKKSKGGGGGGGGSKQKDPKKANEEIDRYHVIKNQLEDINHQLEQVTKAKDRAFGVDKLKYLDQEINKYDNLIAAQKEYVREIEAYYASDRAAMAGYGATFDENGTITNYEQLMIAQINKYNSSLSEEAEEEYNNFKKALDKYEETQDLLKEQTAQLQDYYDKVYDLKLEGIKYKVEFTIEIDDHQLKYLEFLLDQLDDAAYDSAEAFAVLGKQMDVYQRNYDAYKQEMFDILDLATNGNGASALERLLSGEDLESLAKELNLTEEAEQELFAAMEGLIDETKNLKETWKKYLEQMEAFWDAWDEKFQDQIDKIEHLSKVTDNYKKLVDVLGKDRLGVTDATLQRLNHTMTEAAKANYEAQNTRLEAARNLLAEAVAKGWDEDPEYDEYMKGLRKNIDELEEAAQDAAINVAETAQKELEDRTQIIIENWQDAVAGIQKNLEGLNEAMDRAQKVKEQYMETYEQAYQIAKLAKDIGKSINDSAVLKNKQELAGLLDHINQAQEAGVKMSEYEYEAYRKEYELLLAKAALEDAREAKSQVRMTRDSEGNMSYVYTADQDKVADAEQNYNDVAYEFAQLNAEQIMEAQQQLLDLDNWYQQQLEKRHEYTEEEWQEIQDYYTESMEYWCDQMDIAFGWNESLTEQTGLLQWELADNFADTVLSQVDGFQTLDDYMNAHVEASQNALEELSIAWEEYIDDTNEVAQMGEEYINQELDLVDQGMEETRQNVDELAQDFDREMHNMVNSAENFRQNYEAKVQNAIEQTTMLGNAVSALGDTFLDQMSKYEGAAGALRNYTRAAYEAAAAAAALAAAQGGSTGGVNSGPGGPSGGNKKYELYGVTYNTRSEAEMQARTYSYGVMGYNGGMTAEQIMKDIKEVSYDTGGYTGEWGSDGRMAMLHEKELVLNASDTANMFKIIDAVREVTDAMALQSHGANVDLNNAATASVGGMMSIDQNVNITAEFPNATDRYEIEAAFGDIINRASQYINRKV